MMAADLTENQGRASDTTHERIDHASDRVKSTAAGVAETAKTKTAAAVDHAESGVRRATDAGAKAAHHTADKAADWRDRGTGAVDYARQRSDDLLEGARGFVREKPVQSVALALAAGWLIGRILSSRR